MRIVIVSLVFITIALAIRFVLYFSSQKQYKNGEAITLTTTLLREPKVSRGQQIIRIDQYVVFVPQTIELSYGDQVKVSGVVKEKETAYGVQKSIITPKVQKITSIQTPLFTLTSAIRARIVTVFTKYLPSEEAGLLLGIVLGVRDQIDSGFYEKLRNTGVLHVVAASGSNVALIGGFILSSSALFLRRQYAIFITILTLFFYALLSGLDASIVRAAIMGAFTYTAMLLGRQAYSFLSLFFASSLMLFVSPKTLFDVGFELSVASTLGILAIKPSLDIILKGFKKLLLMDDFTTTISAQTYSLPIILSAFSSYAWISIVVNLSILWTVPILMMLGGLAALLSFIPVLPAPFLYLSYPFLLFFKTVTGFFSQFVSSSSEQSVSPFVICGYVLFVFAATLLLHKKAKHS